MTRASKTSPGDCKQRACVKSVTLLGSTGSVGRSAVDLLSRSPGAYRVEALVGNRNVAVLAAQARALKASTAVAADPGCYGALKDALCGTGVACAAGPEAVIEAASRPSDWVLSAIVGAAGLGPTMAAVRRGAVVALANKESLVCAGRIVMSEAARCGATVLPVDSEHSAIFQVFDFDQADKVGTLTLTASGGPFRTRSRAEMASVTPAEAVTHPNWSMGAKISVDSATMMNKGLELIEAHHLFNMPGEKIDIVVHPQSVIHSMVSYVDGSVLAQLGVPDMRTPIAYALGWPRRIPRPGPGLDLARIARLTFEAPDPERFPALRLVRDALDQGGTAPIVLNAANEVAVARFLQGGLAFLDIAAVVEHSLTRSRLTEASTLEDVGAADCHARRVAATACARRAL